MMTHNLPLMVADSFTLTLIGLLPTYLLMTFYWISTHSKIKWNLIDIFGVLLAAFVFCFIRCGLVFWGNSDRFGFSIIQVVITGLLLGLISLVGQLDKGVWPLTKKNVSIFNLSILIISAVVLALVEPVFAIL